MKQDITVLDAANTPSGPFSLQEVQQKLASGEFKPTQLAFKEGLSAWTPLSEIIAQMAPPTSPAPEPEPPRSFSTTPSSPAPSSFGQSAPTSPASFGQSSAPESAPISQPGISTTYSTPAASSTLYGAPGGIGAPTMPGTFWKRLVAFLIDYLIIGAVLLIPYLVIVIGGLLVVSLVGSDGNGNPTILGTVIMIFAYALVFAIVLGGYAGYFGYLESSPEQASYGKRIFGLRVTSDDGSKLSFKAAALRGVVKCLSIGFTCCIGTLLPLFTDKSKALHDMICGTVVVEPRV